MQIGSLFQRKTQKAPSGGAGIHVAVVAAREEFQHAIEERRRLAVNHRSLSEERDRQGMRLVRIPSAIREVQDKQYNTFARHTIDPTTPFDEQTFIDQVKVLRQEEETVRGRLSALEEEINKNGIASGRADDRFRRVREGLWAAVADQLVEAIPDGLNPAVMRLWAAMDRHRNGIGILAVMARIIDCEITTDGTMTVLRELQQEFELPDESI